MLNLLTSRMVEGKANFVPFLYHSGVRESEREPALAFGAMGLMVEAIQRMERSEKRGREKVD